MTVKERVLHSILFEVIALVLFVPLAMAVTGQGAGTMTALSVAMSLIAMVWNFVYNWGFDAVFGNNRLARGFSLRLFHGVCFELGLIFVSLPLLMYVLQEGFLKVLALDLGAVVFFLIYAIVFNWIYDILRNRIQPYARTSK
ncbi:MAG: PACE efflux transporter [Roseibium sp.]|uniref:PACE efflux transporter n=1 Tax=Roseibium sp. TaxID=1936156 RepID=UPI00260BA7DD|nr:PACE efflux transporter [Roseibium sp.]MCV0429488.1 PACE efflux transporter [Roseibium sp.]